MADGCALYGAWKLLGVREHPTRSELRRAYKLACLRYHPDKHPAGSERQAAERRFKQVCTLYDALLTCGSDESEYDSSERSTESSTGTTTTTPSSSSSSLARNAVAGGRKVHKRGGVSVNLGVTLEELASGSRRRVVIGGDPVLITVQKGARAGDSLETHGVRIVLSLCAHAYSVTGDNVIAVVTQAKGAPCAFVRTLDGDTVRVRTPADARETCANGAYVDTLPGRGLPCRADPTKRGALIVIVRESAHGIGGQNTGAYGRNCGTHCVDDAVIGTSMQRGVDPNPERASRDTRARRPSMWETCSSTRSDRWNFVRFLRRPFSRW